jgi:phosphinothricin acetyltransferase
MVGAIDAANEVSLKLHTELGFERVGTMPQVGFKFGRWLDLALVQRVLATPDAPVDG